MTDDMPKLTDDMGYWPYLARNGREFFSVGSKKADRYLKVEKGSLEVILEVFGLLDGTHSIGWIENYLRVEKKIEIDVDSLCSRLGDAGLLCGVEPKAPPSEVSVMGVDILKVNFADVGPRLAFLTKVLWNLLFAASIAVLLAFLVTACLKRNNLADITSNAYLYKDSYIKGALITIAFSFVSVLLHELSHWITAIRHGLQPSEFHFALYSGLFPFYYVKIRGMYTVPKSARIAISASGMYSNMALGVLALIPVLWKVLPDYQNQILVKFALSNLYAVIFTLSPFKLTDGYFIISWLTGTSNLRIRMLKSLRNLLNGRKEKLDAVLVVYIAICLTMALTGVYIAAAWNIRVFNDVARSMMNPALKFAVIAIPYIILASTACMFARKLVRFLKTPV